MSQSVNYDRYRASPQQIRVWQSAQRDGSALYRTACWLDIQGSLNIGLLQQAFDSIVQTFDILRTDLTLSEDLPWQVVGDSSCPIQLSCRLCLNQYLLRKTMTDLSGEPQTQKVLSARLLACKPGRHALYLSLPAWLCDRQGLRRLVEELAKAYAVKSLEHHPLKEGDLQYVDYSEWQNALLEDPDMESGRQFWAALLKLSPTTECGCSKNRKTSKITKSLASRALDDIRSHFHDQEISDRDMLLAAWQIAVQTLDHGEARHIGVVHDCRNFEETRSVVGPCSKCVPEPISITADTTVSELVRSIAASQKSIQPWLDYWNPSLTLDSPIQFECIKTAETFWTEGLRFRVVQEYACSEPFALKLVCTQSRTGWILEFHYDCDKHQKDEIRFLAERFVQAISEMVAIDKPLSDLDLVGPRERNKIVRWSHTPTSHDPQVEDILSALEVHVQKRPKDIAIVFGEQQITYASFYARMMHLADTLGARAARPEKRIGVCGPRSIDLVVAVWGILASGAAFVPLDPGWPLARMKNIIERSELERICCDSKTALRLADANCSLIQFESLPSIENIPAIHAKRNDFCPDSLAYEVYTSGSTGVPKGVGVERRHLAAYVRAICERLRTRPGSGFAWLSTPAADLGYTMVFPALASGGRLVIVPEEIATDDTALAKYFETSGVDYLKIVPTHFQALFVGPWGKKIKPRRALVFGGDTLPWTLVDKIHDKGACCKILNHYGPTETTVGCITFDVPTSSTNRLGRSVPLGRPLGKSRIYVLDSHQRVLPVGKAGELYIGGSTVARGYIGQPSLTAEKFVPDQISGVAGGRLYRTGDRARLLRNGTFEFLGRKDHQVKIRGYRVELLEVESALLRSPDVKEAVVLLRSTAGEPQLVAYITLSEATEKKSSVDLDQLKRDLQEYARERLPAYMVPAAIMVIPALPLTANGKLDRTALQAIEQQPIVQQTQWRTPVEELIAGVWSSVLNREDFCAQTNFFEVGGHSLLATVVAARLRTALNMDLPMQWMFEYPTIAALAKAITGLQRSALGFPPLPILREQRPDRLPLSYAQLRLWFLDQFEPGTNAYNMFTTLWIEGELRPEALGHAVEDLVKRHEILRTTFRAEDGQPIQVVSSDVSAVFDYVDLSSQQDGEERARAQARNASQTPFDLTRGPLLRVSLIRTKPTTFLLTVVIHHIVSDGWSLRVLVRDLTACYEARVSGTPSQLPNLPVQYADFVIWHRNWLSSGRLDHLLTYWRQQLAGLLPLNLPTDRVARALTHRGASVPLLLSVETSKQVRRFSRDRGVTLFMTLLAAFQVLLARYTGQSDVAVGTPITNRHLEEFERLIGLFVNTLVLRVRIDGNMSFEDLVQRTRTVVHGAYAHQDLPFEKLIEELSPRRDVPGSPLFNVMFMMNDLPQESATISGIEIGEAVPVENDPKFALTFALKDSSSGIHGNIQYDADLFEQSTITRLANNFTLLIHSLLDAPERSIWDAELIAPQETELIGSWSSSETNPTRFRDVAEQFVHQASETPGSTALIYRDSIFSYDYLNRWSNRVAHYLQRRGVHEDVVVGICADRGVAMVVGMLAIIKSGGAYLPLDPGHPVERLDAILLEAKPHIILTTQSLTDVLASSRYEAELLDIETDGERITAENETTPPYLEQENALAYVLYTSGSTGKPKGVMLTRKGLAVYLSWARANYRTRPGGVVPLHSPIIFDMSITSILLPLISGAAVHLYSPEEGFTELVRNMADGREYSLVKITPSHLRAFNEILPSSKKDLPEALVIGGEALSYEHVAGWRNKNGKGPRLINEYGPTETVVGCCVYEVGDESDTRGPIPIGKPIPHTQAYVLGPTGQLAPVGATGELFIGGSTVGRGYLNNPRLTAWLFVPDPFSGTRGARLYRTGDLARWLPSGSLEYLGRGDRQIKVRGFRIEAGDVESALRQLRGVRDAAVIAGKDGQQLIAFVVSDTWDETRDLKEDLKRILPSYMVPQIISRIPQLPITSNGKLDVTALEQLIPRLPAPVVLGPRNETEKALMRIWEAVLGTEGFGIHDDFFSLGGHSLSAVVLQARIAHEFGRQLPLKALFDSPTVARLGVELAAVPPTSNATTPQCVALRAGEHDPALFLIHPVSGDIACFRELASSMRLPLSLYAIEAPFLFSISENAEFASVEERAGYYVRLVRSVQRKGPYFLAGYSLGGKISFEMARQLNEMEETVAFLGIISSAAPRPNLTAPNVTEHQVLKRIKQFIPHPIHSPQSPLDSDPVEQLAEILHQWSSSTNGSSVPGPFTDTRASAARILKGYLRRVNTVSRYVPSPYRGPITLFVPRGSTSNLARRGAAADSLGWDQYSAEPVNVVSVAGNHKTVLSSPDVAQLARAMDQALLEVIETSKLASR
jgi:amino acid adenylation domain-containing protein